MRKTYKNEQLMKILTILGAIIGLVGVISMFASLAGYGFFPTIDVLPGILNTIVYAIIGLVIVILTFLCALKPNEPLPFNWIILLILAILLIIFAGLWGGLLVLIAALIGLIEDL